MKASWIIIATLLAFLIYILFDRHSLNTRFQSETQRYQDSLHQYADSLRLKLDTLAYHRLVSLANNHLFHLQYDEAARRYRMADSLGLGGFEWSMVAKDFIAAQNAMKTTAYGLLQQIRELENAAIRDRGRRGELEEEARAKTKEAEALKRQLYETIYALNAAVIENERLENRIQDAKSSYGKLNFSNTEGKSIVYYGEIAQGKANGAGIGIIADKAIYEGQWKDNLRHGNGKYTWSNGDVYEGEFVEGKRNGYGVYWFTSGEKYMGEWKNDVREGKGAMYSKEGKVLVEGLWVNDKFKKES